VESGLQYELKLDHETRAMREAGMCFSRDSKGLHACERLQVVSLASRAQLTNTPDVEECEEVGAPMSQLRNMGSTGSFFYRPELSQRFVVAAEHTLARSIS
jgi:hypothetical protein